MRIALTLALGVLIGGTTTAQLSTMPASSTQKMTAPHSKGYITPMPTEHVTVTPGHVSPFGPESSGSSTIWSEDFSGGFPSTWTIDDTSGICAWKYSTNGSQGNFAGANPVVIASATASNGFLISDPDSSNFITFGLPAGTTYQDLSTYFVTDGISTTGNPAVRLEFTQHFRHIGTPDLNVLVSNTSANGPWVGYTLDNSGNSFGSGPNPQNISIQLPASMGNQPNIWIKIGWRSSSYFWQIDDMRIITAPNYDLQLVQEYYGALGDSTRTAFYYAMPERQANSFTTTFGGVIQNNGQNSSTNTNLLMDVSGLGTYSNSSSSPLTLAPLAIDSFSVTQAFSPDQGVGNYQIDFVATSDSTDCFTDDDTLRHNLAVTNYTYARDRGNSAGGISWAAGSNTHTLAQMFEFPAADTIIGMGISFFRNGATGTTDGGIIEIGIMDTSFTPLAGGTSFYTIDQAVTPFNQYNEIIFENPVYITTPGDYLVYYKLISSSDQMWVSTWDFNIDDAPPLTVFVDVGNTNTWGFTADVPEMRILTRPLACQSVNILAQATVVDNTNQGSITINTITGGAGNYSFSWTGPAGYPGATTQNISNLILSGVYTVTITDGNYCSTSIDFTLIDLIDDITEFDNAAYSFSIVPNPNNGEFSMNFNTPGNDVFTIEVSNMIGQRVATERVSVSGSLQHTMNLQEFGKGVYFVSVINSEDQKHTQRVVVK